MVSTDTVVGIVGAALLAVVMVGVFVYEYNNEAAVDPIGGGGPTPDAAQLFKARYPDLNATGDLDNDGKPNLGDDDLDQDGANNTADPDSIYITSSTGTLGPALPPAVGNDVSLEVVVEEGVVSVKGSVAVTSAQPHNLVVELLGPDGAVVDNMSSVAGSPNSFTLDAGEAPEPGSYTIRVRQDPVGAGASVSLEARADYGLAVEPATAPEP
ncbi:MAG: hypothetical protein QOD77_930 [Thermoplasmata archaeon]|jgi:hypothetical protein|nr:hypothetical protein [Thermoplasmata archaeon]